MISMTEGRKLGTTIGAVSGLGGFLTGGSISGSYFSGALIDVNKEIAKISKQLGLKTNANEKLSLDDVGNVMVYSAAGTIPILSIITNTIAAKKYYDRLQDLIKLREKLEQKKR